MNPGGYLEEGLIGQQSPMARRDQLGRKLSFLSSDKEGQEYAKNPGRCFRMEPPLL